MIPNPATSKAAATGLKPQTTVLLVDDQPARAALLEQALLDQGYAVAGKLATAEGLLQAVDTRRPDIIIIDVDSPDRDTLEHMAHLHGTHSMPVVMFVEQDVPQTVSRAIAAGVSVYVVEGLQPQLVKSIVDVAIARFREYQALRTELEQTRHALADRKLLERAKGLLMQHRHCSEEQAWQAMRKLAMDKGQRLVTVASNIIDIHEMLGNAPVEGN